MHEPIIWGLMELQSTHEKVTGMILPWDHYVRHLPVKRLFDLLFSSAVLLLTLPLILLLAVVIRFSSKGSVFYAHERIGRGGKPFKCYKFRTMFGDADKRLYSLLDSNPRLREEWEATQKLKEDPRVTKVGRILRKLSIDEFPQFWNVVRGDMSVVGPRPMVREEIESKLGDKAPLILSVRPGLTGIWQTSGRSDTSYMKRIQLDEQYVTKRSLWLDLKLVLKTVPTMLKARGAY